MVQWDKNGCLHTGQQKYWVRTVLEENTMNIKVCLHVRSENITSIAELFKQEWPESVQELSGGELIVPREICSQAVNSKRGFCSPMFKGIKWRKTDVKSKSNQRKMPPSNQSYSWFWNLWVPNGVKCGQKKNYRICSNRAFIAYLHKK